MLTQSAENDRAPDIRDFNNSLGLVLHKLIHRPPACPIGFFIMVVVNHQIAPYGQARIEELQRAERRFVNVHVQKDKGKPF